jgi:hypothetical protein
VNFSHGQPFSIPADTPGETIFIPAVIPAGHLQVAYVTISDPARIGKPFRCEWQVDFAEDVRTITEAEAQVIFDAATARVHAKLGGLN